MTSFNAVIVTHAISTELSSMVERNLSHHLKTWCVSVDRATFRIVTIGDLIYLETNSAELLDLFKRYEAPYIEYLIKDEILRADELEIWDPKQAA